MVNLDKLLLVGCASILAPFAAHAQSAQAHAESELHPQASDWLQMELDLLFLGKMWGDDLPRFIDEGGEMRRSDSGQNLTVSQGAAQATAGPTPVMLVARIVGYTPLGPGRGTQANKHVIQVYPLPRPERGEILVTEGCVAGPGPNAGQPVYANARMTRTRVGARSASVSAAWRLNTATSRLEPVPARGVVCTFEDP